MSWLWVMSYKDQLLTAPSRLVVMTLHLHRMGPWRHWLVSGRVTIGWMGDHMTVVTNCFLGIALEKPCCIMIRLMTRGWWMRSAPLLCVLLGCVWEPEKAGGTKHHWGWLSLQPAVWGHWRQTSFLCPPSKSSARIPQRCHGLEGRVCHELLEK